MAKVLIYTVENDANTLAAKFPSNYGKVIVNKDGDKWAFQVRSADENKYLDSEEITDLTALPSDFFDQNITGV